MINYFDKFLESLNFKRLFPPMWRYEFDEKQYFKEWKLLKSVNCFLVAIGLLGFSDFIVNKYGKVVIEFLKFNFKINQSLQIVVYYLLVIHITIILINRLRHGYLITINSLFYSVAVVFVYNELIVDRLLLLNNLSENFESIFFVLLIYFIIYTSKWSLYYVRLDTQNNNYRFVLDHLNSSDLFNYSGLSKELTKFIHNTESEQAFNIGVVGGWGDGKTFFSNLVKNELEKHKDDYIIIEFNPWQYESNNLIDNFFTELISTTKFLNKDLTTDIEKYVNLISDSYENDKLNVSFKLISILNGNKSIIELKQEISNKLKMSRKKIVVIVDDIDRLDSQEIMSVLKLIRNSANFSNTFFIAGIDVDYVYSKIDNSKYIEKIFNVLISLPILSLDLYEKTIVDKFEKEFDDPKLIDSLRELLRNTSFVKIVRNIRQVNRLINSLKIAYNKLKGNIDYTDLLILEAIKASNTIVYNQILNNVDYVNEFLQEDDNIDPCAKDLKYINLNRCQEFHLRKLLEILGSDKKNIKGYSNQNRLLYFNYANYGLDIVKFFNVVEESTSEIVNKFNNWLSEGEMFKKDLFSILLIYLNDNKNKKIIPALLELKDAKFSRDVIISGFLNKTSLLNDLYELLREMLDYYDENNSIQNKIVILEIVSDLVLRILKLNVGDVKVLNSDFKNDVLNLYIKTIKDLIDKNEDVKKVFEIFKLSTIEIINDYLIYDDRIIKIVKDYVSKGDNFNKLIEETLIGKKWSGNYDDFTREIVISNFIKILFSESETKNLINKSYPETNIPHVEFLKHYINEFYSYNKSTTFTKYVNDEDLHNKFLKYYSK